MFIESERVPKKQPPLGPGQTDIPIITKAWITGDGQIIEKATLSKKGDVEAAKTQTQSKQIQEDGFDYEKDGLIKPPFDLSKMASLLTINTDHMRCVKAKAADVTGRGWDIVEDEQAHPGEKGSPQDRQMILDVLNDVNPDMTFTTILNNAWEDLESTGNGAIEIGRNAKGQPSRMWHTQSTTVRIRKGGEGYVQIVGEKKVFFQKMGDKYVRTPGGEGVWKNVDPATGKVKEGLTFTSAANELLYLKLYSAQSTWYGVPDFIPAIPAIMGNEMAQRFNTQFFEHNAIPQYAVIIKGATLTDPVRKMIEDYFNTEIKGKAHKTFIISVPSTNVEIEFQPLATDMKEASWAGYRRDNRDEIMRAHGVHPARIGVIETGQLGSGSGLSQQENYKNNTVEPRQSSLEFTLTSQIIRQGFGVKGWKIKFEDLDIRDREKETNMGLAVLGRGAVSINWLRTNILGEKDIDGGDRPFIMTPGGPMFIDEMGAAKDNGVGKEEGGVNLQKVLGDAGENVEFVQKAVQEYLANHPELQLPTT